MTKRELKKWEERLELNWLGRKFFRVQVMYIRFLAKLHCKEERQMIALKKQVSERNEKLRL